MSYIDLYSLSKWRSIAYNSGVDMFPALVVGPVIVAAAVYEVVSVWWRERSAWRQAVRNDQ
jgi:hypothetical protein